MAWDAESAAPSVLLVEDNEVNQIVAVAVLRRRGYAATAELRSRESATEHVPVIALTAHASDGERERERCLAPGMDDFLTKPVRPEALVAALDRAIGGGNGVIDHDALRRLAEALDESTLERVVEVFLDQSAAYVATICATPDDATLRRTAHALKGSAVTVGATAVAELTRR